MPPYPKHPSVDTDPDPVVLAAFHTPFPSKAECLAALAWSHEYRFYVVVRSAEVNEGRPARVDSGFEYRADAKDRAIEVNEDPYLRARIYSRRMIEFWAR